MMTSEDIRNNLLTRARAYAERASVSFSAISLAAVNDDKFLRRVEKGSGFNINTYQRVLDWLDAAEATCGEDEAEPRARHVNLSSYALPGGVA